MCDTAGDMSHILRHLTRSNAGHLRRTPDSTYTANLVPLWTCQAQRWAVILGQEVTVPQEDEML